MIYNILIFVHHIQILLKQQPSTQGSLPPKLETQKTYNEQNGDQQSYQQIIKQLQGIQSQLQNTQVLVEQSLKTAGLSQQKIDKLWEKKYHHQSKSSNDKETPPQTKRKIKEKQKWSIAEHKKLLEFIKKYGPNNVKQITELMEGRTEPQVRSHLQKYREKLSKAIQDVQAKLDVDKSINQFQQQFITSEDSQKEIKFQQFIQQFKQKFFNITPPITTDVIAQAMKDLRQLYPDEILFGNYLKPTIVTEQDELLCAISGQYCRNNSETNLFIYPYYNPSDIQLQIQETQTNFQMNNNSMSTIAEQQKKSQNLKFNCNFVVQYCEKVLMDLIEKQKFKEMITVVLMIEQQIIKVGDTFEYSISYQCEKNGKSVEQIKLIMFCLRCVASL